MKTFKTREDWLQAAVAALRPRVQKHGKLPEKVNTICSWPLGSKTAIGQFFAKTWTKDGSTYVAVSPSLPAGKPERILDVVLHEMVHALGFNGPGKEFKAAAEALGLEGPMRATTASKELEADLKKVAATLGAYPHAEMVPQMNVRQKSKTKAQIKLVSPVEESYSVWLTPKQFEAHGAPICPISKQQMVPAE